MGGAGSVGLVSATALGLTLLLAGAAKARDARPLGLFLDALGAGPRVSRALRVAAPVAELLVGACLVAGVVPLAAAAAAVLLGAAFAGTLALATLRGVAQPCRCFGALDRAASHRVALARALVVLGGAVAALAAALLEPAAPAVASSWAARAVGCALFVCCVVAFTLLGEVAAFRAGVRRELDRGQAR